MTSVDNNVTLSEILKKVRAWSEDLSDKNTFTDIKWVEIKKDNQHDEKIMHIFEEDGNYILLVNGVISKGSWKLLKNSNTILVELQSFQNTSVSSNLYDLEFINEDFFILRNTQSSNNYLALSAENVLEEDTWEELLLSLTSTYKSHFLTIFGTIIIILVVIIALFLYFF